GSHRRRRRAELRARRVQGARELRRRGVSDVQSRRAHHELLTLVLSCRFRFQAELGARRHSASRRKLLGMAVDTFVTGLANKLDRLYDAYNREDAALDPVQIVRRYTKPADQEVIGFCAAALAFGRVRSVLNTVNALAGALGPSPAAWVRRF